LCFMNMNRAIVMNIITTITIAIIRGKRSIVNSPWCTNPFMKIP
jgi:hypothetical protein